jgi:plastocyanin
MLPTNDENNKVVFVTLALMLLSLSVTSSIAISTPNYASAQGVTGQGGGNATNATSTMGAGNATNATTTGASGGNTTTSVSIVPGASTLSTDAFSPNPIQVNVGSTVTWTNNDSQAHTVNSGNSPTQSGLFDSPIIAPQATFEYTFTEAGEVPYFCILHPNMVGTLSVS